MGRRAEVQGWVGGGRLVLGAAELLRERVELLHLTGQPNPHARVRLNELHELLRLLGRRELDRLLGGVLALGPQPVLREVVRADLEALREVAVVLVAVL